MGVNLEWQMACCHLINLHQIDFMHEYVGQAQLSYIYTLLYWNTSNALIKLKRPSYFPMLFHT